MAETFRCCDASSSCDASWHTSHLTLLQILLIHEMVNRPAVAGCLAAFVRPGLLLPDSGQVSCCGSSTSVASRGELARKVALVGQQPALGFPYSVIEVVLMGRAPYLEGLSLENEEDLAVAHDAMRATGTDHLGGRVFDSLSSGERQRVSVARALAQQRCSAPPSAAAQCHSAVPQPARRGASDDSVNIVIYNSNNTNNI